MMSSCFYRPVRLPMYDWPEVAVETRALEAAMTDEICSELSIAPSGLLGWEFETDLYDLWKDPGLLLGQTCGYPLTHALQNQVAVVGAPHYGVDGCYGPNYCSHIVVRSDSSYKDLADLKGVRAVFNGPDSQSGMNALRHAIAPLAGAKPFFKSVDISGGHLASLDAVANGKADVAAIDAVCWALAQQERPALVEGLRPLAKTAAAPSLPFITSVKFNADAQVGIRNAVSRVLTSSETQKSRERLGLRGFSKLKTDNYQVILDMEAEAKAAGYSVLA